ncbi:thiolase C-terminal domain-containing protein [Actinophytocola sp.]|uniref:thiolase C-terminal domain-containing protein n=1 Tax=Actinophytocola sp. TaxID=1872138 RepID=UPI003D6A9C61
MSIEPPRAAIVGIGATDFSARSGRSELELACQAILAALDDAGIDPGEVDGLVRFGASQRRASEGAVAHALGLGGLSYWSEVDLGGGASAALVGHAAMAVGTGAARCVVGYRALNGRSGARPGTSQTSAALEDIDPHYRDFLVPHGLTSPVQMYALIARRYLHHYALPGNALGGVARSFRRHADRNPNAQLYGRPLGPEEYDESEVISSPLRKLDCCLQTDGAAAFVVVPADRAGDLAQPPAYVRGSVQASMANQPGFLYSFVGAGDVLRTPAEEAAGRLYARAGLTAGDVDVAQLYDCFSITAVLAAEAYGFCAPGEGAQRAAAGMFDLGGGIPANTAGGSFGEGYIHGVNHVLEGVRQIRGRSTSQVPGAATCLVTGGMPVPTSAVLLTKDAA